MLANMNTQAAAGDVAEGAQQRFLHDIVDLGEGSRAAAELEVDQHGQPPLVFFEGAGEGVPGRPPGHPSRSQLEVGFPRSRASL